MNRYQFNKFVKMSIKEISKKIYKKIKEKVLNLFIKIKKSFIKTHNGEENFYLMLWGWGIIPAILVIFFLEDKLRKIHIGFIAIPLHLVVITFFIWHILAIRKTLKKHPEYKEKKEKEEKKYKGLSKEKIKELKKQEQKEKNINIVKKAILVKAWDTMPLYKIVILIDLFVILTQIQRILYIL